MNMTDQIPNEKDDAVSRMTTGTDAIGEVEPEKNFNTMSTFSLSLSLMATWEALLSTIGLGLTAGGSVALVYGFLLSFVGNICTAMSLSEPAAMYPNAGGQYYMIAELTSGKTKALLSWYTGWLSLVGWVALTASGPYGAANIIQGLVVLNYDDYEPKAWRWYLIYLTITVLSFLMNIWGGKVLPMLENAISALHVLFFFMVLIAAAALPKERQSAEFVFTHFANGTGWDSNGIAWGIGMLTSAYIMIGYDSAAHMSEEMRNPRTGVPRAMIGSIIVNGAMGFAMLLVILFGIQDLDAALTTKTGFPIIEIFYQMTRGNKAAASAMSSTIAISAGAATVGLIAATSRTLWSFARDGAPAYSGRLAQLSENSHVPFNAVAFVSLFVIILGLLNIASTTAFSAVLSVTVIGMSLSYLTPIVAMLYRKIWTPVQLEYGPWKMPRMLGIAVNMFSICYILFLTAFLVLPTVMPVTAQNMNYASVILGGVLILVTIDWIFRGRKAYNGPKNETYDQ
ncbi:hypothetical protein NLU13_7983 [Sarocladium strictum]|uniref:Uncharacterized protein n=1 Tax=Sarocladium strictum TaxID=5046 RepID=A0AA39GBA0_SARSR|nr:hypothetical protein NLU13_7983 [Sarocladium strictum]